MSLGTALQLSVRATTCYTKLHIGSLLESVDHSLHCRPKSVFFKNNLSPVTSQACTAHQSRMRMTCTCPFVQHQHQTVLPLQVMSTFNNTTVLRSGFHIHSLLKYIHIHTATFNYIYDGWTAPALSHSLLTSISFTSTSAITPPSPSSVW